MSGFEIAGVILGAFPLLITALEKYEEVGRRYDFWRRIRPEYRKCSHDLKYHSDVFRMNLRQLLLPQVADDDMIDRMITDPGGDLWKVPEMSELLARRLQGSYENYTRIMARFQDTMEALGLELDIDANHSQLSTDEVQGTIHGSSTSVGQLSFTDRIKSSLSKSNRDYQLYRFRFSNGAGARQRLLGELKEHNDRLEKLLKNCDKEAKIISRRSPASASPTAPSAAYERVLCEFWRKAASLFRVLCNNIRCGCMNTHQASILLRHPQTSDNGPSFEANVLLMTKRQKEWVCCETTIAATETFAPLLTIVTSKNGQDRLTGPLPHRPEAKPRLRSAMKSHSSTKSAKGATFVESTPPGQSEQITSICEYLLGSPSHLGYIKDDDCRYELSPTQLLVVRDDFNISLRRILHGPDKLGMTRRRRTALALTLASAFVQLAESPWFPSSRWSEEDVFFIDTGGSGCQVQVDRPHVRQKLDEEGLQVRAGPAEHDSEPVNSGLQDSLTRLGIVLLELCFGNTLDSQACRQSFPAGQTAREKDAFDLAAALIWMREVNEEAGRDYATAVSWCLIGSRTLTSDVPSWRKVMVEQVIRPLDACNTYLAH
ncbi:unnamed protein product [Clonostachys rosea]|uniref:DUF7580 domain-containing protein n=1 Tax=Bionectria ochroleuca TaxID=29856 RepID=A0ABY6UWR6_BIOOC|nr:unnamed protein product [Clonostachys rosea]